VEKTRSKVVDGSVMLPWLSGLDNARAASAHRDHRCVGATTTRCRGKSPPPVSPGLAFPAPFAADRCTSARSRGIDEDAFAWAAEKIPLPGGTSGLVRDGSDGEATLSLIESAGFRRSLPMVARPG